MDTDNRPYMVLGIKARCGHFFDRIVYDTDMLRAMAWADLFYSDHLCDECMASATELVNFMADILGGSQSYASVDELWKSLEDSM